MFQIIKHIKNFKVSGEIYCNHYNSGLSLEAARQARRTIYHAGSEAWGPLHYLVHNPRKGRSSPEKLLLEHGGQWGPCFGLKAGRKVGLSGSLTPSNLPWPLAGFPLDKYGSLEPQFSLSAKESS